MIEKSPLIFNTNISTLIRQRHSCRSYESTALSADDLNRLHEAAELCQTGPFGNQIRIKIISSTEKTDADLRQLGTYGFIKNPTGYIIIAAQDLPGAMEDVGYLIETLILKATDLGIGTCWLGGTFTKSRFANSIKLNDSETIPAVISIGYPLNRQAIMDRISRIYAGADRRLPREELFYQDTFDDPLSQSLAGTFQEPLEMIRLAPSASNKQPWRVVQKNNQYHFYLERTKNYPTPFFNRILKLADLQRIDIGIAMAHFELSLSELDLGGEWVHTDPGLSAQNMEKEYIITWKPLSIS